MMVHQIIGIKTVSEYVSFTVKAAYFCVELTSVTRSITGDIYYKPDQRNLLI